MKNGKLQIGIIGCGGIANQKHLPSLAKQADLCEIAAFCDIIEERAVKAAATYGTPKAKIYADYLKLLQDDNIDVVHILTPNVMHSPMTVAAFAAGKHVMCEKPMAHNSAEAQKMLDAARKAGKKFTIGYQNRFREDVQALRKAVDNGYLGDIYFAKAHAIRRRAVPTWGVFPNKALQGGGPLIDIGTHALDITLWMMDNYKPATVAGSVFWKMADKFEGNSFGPWDPATFEVEDSAFGFIKMADGATIFLETSWALNIADPREAAATLCGTSGGAEIRGGSEGQPYKLTLNTTKYGHLVDEEIINSGGVAYFEGKGNDPGSAEARQWLEAVIRDTQPLVLPEQAFVVTQILEAVYRSQDTGEMVRF